ncbi:hypothetical protein, partial [Enterobacter hormaechei]
RPRFFFLKGDHDQLKIYNFVATLIFLKKKVKPRRGNGHLMVKYFGGHMAKLCRPSGVAQRRS